MRDTALLVEMTEARTAEIVAEFIEDRDATNEQVALRNLARALERAEREADPSREVRESIVRSLKIRYGLRQSIPELMMGFDIALAEQGR